MNKIIDFSNYILNNLNLKIGQCVEIVGPKECEELVVSLEKVCLSSFYQPFITYNNLDDEYYIERNTQFYLKLMNNDFNRIIITSSFQSPKNKYFLDTHSDFLNDYFENKQHKYTIVVYPNTKWAMNLGIKYNNLRDRIIDISMMQNTLSNDINKLYNLNIKYLNIKNSLGTNLNMELASNFKFNDGKVLAYDNTYYYKNIPCLEIFTSPIKNSVNGILYSSKGIYINSHIINSFNLEFKDGMVIYSRGLDSLIKEEDGLKYLGEIGISMFNEFIFYNTLLDENSSIHVALGNSYSMGIDNKYLNKLNKSKHHIDLPIGTSDTVITFYNKDMKIVSKFINNKFIYEDLND